MNNPPKENFSFFFSISISLLVVLLFQFEASSQAGRGLPVWTISNSSNNGLQIIDWKTSPYTIQTLNLTSPSLHCPAVPAVSACGDPVFFIRHSGQYDAANNLFIYAPDGSVLLGYSTPNGPGFNAKRTAYEYQVLKVPGSLNEWFIIYSKWVSDVGAPIGSGGYVSSNILYSRVRYSCGAIEVLERDVPLLSSGVAYKYSTALAVSATADPEIFFLYANRRTENSDFLSLDRFQITNSGISWDKNTGNIYADFSIFAIDASPLAVSNDGKRIALCNRNDHVDDIDIILFDAEDFSNAPGSCREISAGELMLQPDNQVLFTEMSVQSAAQAFSELSFLANMERKIVHITFSPSGKYLYFTHGGFTGSGGYYNTYNYIGQIEIGTYDLPEPYPFKLRLQIEIAPSSSNFDGTRHIQQCFDGNIYFIKWTSPFLYVIPEPDSPLQNNLIPYHIDLSNSENPNIATIETIWYAPDQIDGFDYITAERPVISLGKDTSICTEHELILTPGDQFITYCWHDSSTDPVYLAKNQGEYWVEIMDENGCFARDTVFISVTENNMALGNDFELCQGDSLYLSPGSEYVSYFWQDGSDNQEIMVKDSGFYWLEVTDINGCTARDTVLVSLKPSPEVVLGQDTILAPGEIIKLDAGPGFASYLWQDGSAERYFEVTHEGKYWVTASLNYCYGSDTINIFYDDCSANLHVPNCFTPNNDGINDKFAVTAANIDLFSLLIFNRWGQLLFESNDINNSWDGRVNSKICPIGTYFYLIRYESKCSGGIGKSGEKTGSITLLE